MNKTPSILTYDVIFTGEAVQWSRARRLLIIRLKAANCERYINEDPPTYLMFKPRLPSILSAPRASTPLRTSLPERVDTRASSARLIEARADEEAATEEAEAKRYQEQMAYLKDIDDWNKRNDAWYTPSALCFKILNESISPIAKSLCRAAFETGNPKEIWNALNAQYGAAPESSVAEVYNRLSEMVLLPNQSISVFVEILEEMYQTLQARGEVLSSMYKLSIFTQGIEKSKRREEFVTALTLCRLSHKNYDQTAQFLITEDLNKPKVESSKSSSAAYSVTDTVPATYKCYNCNKSGLHWRRDCPQPKKSTTPKPSDSKSNRHSH